ncbi:MAG: DUF349 domain-containing protein [Thiohalomonadales bacterium]
MLVGKLFAPKWKHRNKNVRKKALLELDPGKQASQQIYLEITQNDLDIELRKLALKRLMDVKVLIELGNLHRESLGGEINTRLGQLLSKAAIDTDVIETIVTYLQACNDSGLLKLVLAQSHQEILRQTALLSLDKNTHYAATAMSDESAALRFLAVQHIKKLSTLQRVLKHSKNKDKAVYKLAKEKIAAEQNSKSDPKQLQRSLHSLQTELKAIITACEEKNAWGLQQAQIEVLLSDWLRLKQEFSAASLSWDGDSQAEFSRQLDHYNEALTREHVVVKAQQADAEEFEVFKEILQEYVETLQASIAALHTTTKRESWQQLTDKTNNIGELWRQIQVDQPGIIGSPFMRKTIDEFSKCWQNYQAEVNNVDQLISQCERQQAVINHMQSLLDSEKNLQSKTIENFTRMVDTQFAESSVASPGKVAVELIAAAKEERQKFKQLLSQLQARLTAQSVQNMTRLDELAEILPDLARALSQGKAKFAVNLTRRWRKLTTSLDLSARQSKKYKALSTEYNQLQLKVSELREWREWSNLPVKQKLCQDVTVLAEELKANANNPSYDHTATMEQLRAYRRDWNKLVDSEFKQDKQLEKKFAACCEEVSKLNQTFFAGLAEKRQTHYDKRQRYCAELDAYGAKLTNMSLAEIDLKHLEKVIRVSAKEWYSLGVVDRAKKEGVNKQFSSVLSVLTQIRDTIRAENSDAKNKLIARAKKSLADAESDAKNISSSIESIKYLQTQWKMIGVATRDRECWQEFQESCNKVFECRNSQSKQQVAERDKHSKELAAVCAAIEKLSNEKFDPISNAPQQFSTLVQQWADLSSETAIKGIDRRYKSACQKFELALQLHRDQHKKANSQTLRKLWDLCIEIESQLAKSLLDGQVLEKLSAEMQRLNDAKEGMNVQKNSYAQQLLLRIARVEQCLSDLVSGVDSEQNESAMRSSIMQKESASVSVRKRLCLHAEIIANVESPLEERPARMEYQVSMLAKRMTQGKPGVAVGENELLQLVNDWHRESVIVDPVGIDLEKRFSNAISKIDSIPV